MVTSELWSPFASVRLRTGAAKRFKKVQPLIRDLLGEPDVVKANPHHLSGPPMRLFAEARVVVAEASPEWRAVQAAPARRRAGASRAVETKRARLERESSSIVIEVPLLDLDHLRDVARRSAAYLGNNDNRSGERLEVNYLRHEMTHYEAHLAAIKGRVGAADAYLTIKGKVLDAIAAKYPHLAAECDRQFAEALCRE